jgi:ABC-type taurine transport system ATPase subunit
VRSQQLLGRDVTGQSVDLTAGITNLDSKEAALRRILSRAGSIPGVLEVQNELFTVEGEVQQRSAEEGSLLNHATFATLTAAIVPTSAAAAAVRQARQHVVLRARHLAGHHTLLVLHDVALALGWAFPLLIAAGAAAGGVLLRRRIRLHRRGRRAAPAVD